MLPSIRPLLLLAFLTGLLSPLGAQADAIPEPVRAFARDLLGEVDSDSVRATAVPQLYEVRLEGQFLYVTADGRHFVYGDLYESRSRTNLTEHSRRESRLDIVGAIDPDTFIVFAPEEIKHTVTVFTDVDCPYCAKLHQEVPELNALGVGIRYAAWPRTPPGTESYLRSVSVWCASDPHQALTDAKAGRDIAPAECENPVAAHLEAGKQVGARGTPTMVTENGDLIGGYVPYRELVRRLESG